ncbi:uncharacterized protein TNCV_4657181 [Trichonephila clavipes]|nr:uncharacterized protein TNCV_4657181 [Trichonephila clavipes]
MLSYNSGTRERVILLENSFLNASNWQSSKFNPQADVQICSAGAWDTHESALAVIGNCATDHNSKCRSYVSWPQNRLVAGAYLASLLPTFIHHWRQGRISIYQKTQ